MKYFLVLLLLFSITIYASDVVEQINVNNLCMCQFDIADDLQLTPKATFVDCRTQVKTTMKSSNIRSEVQSQIRDLQQNNNIICSEADNVAWKEQFLLKQTAQFDSLSRAVEEKLCSSKTENISDEIKTRCREKLVELTTNHQSSVYQGCEQSFLDGEGADTCVKTKVLKYLLNLDVVNYFAQYCPGAEEDKLQCDQGIRDKLKTTFFSESVKYCHNSENFTDKQVTAIRTCENFFIDKTIGFATPDEMELFVSCMNSASGDQAVRACIENQYSGDDERALLAQLEDRYCHKDIYPEEQRRKQCLEELLINNFSNMVNYPECSQLAAIESDPERSQVVYNRCQRQAHFRALLADGTLAASDCHELDNNDSEDFLAQQKSCLEQASAFNDQLTICENRQVPAQVRQCLTQEVPAEMAENLNRHLAQLSMQENIDTSSCSEGDAICRVNLLYADENGDTRLSNINNCSASTSVACSNRNTDVMGLEETMGANPELATNTNNANEGNNVNATNPANTSADSNTNNTIATNTTGGDIERNEGNENTEINTDTDLTLQENTLSIGPESVMTDLSNLRNSNEGSCGCYKEVASTRLIGTIGSNLTLTEANDQASAGMNENASQSQALTSMGILQEGENQSFLIGYAANEYARNKVEKCIYQEQRETLDSNGGVPRGMQGCRDNQTSSLFLLKDLGEFEKVVIHNIEHSQSLQEVNANLNEAIDFINGKESTIVESKMENFPFSLKAYKKYSIAFIKNLKNQFIIGDLQALESGMPLGQSVMGLFNENSQESLQGALDSRDQVRSTASLSQGYHYRSIIENDSEVNRVNHQNGLKKIEMINITGQQFEN